jgi:DNA adenine methylase
VAEKNEQKPDTVEEPRKRTVVKPFLKWPGGKARLAPEVSLALGPHLGGRYYIEPFCGAMAVYLYLLGESRIGPGRVILSDANVNLVLLITMVRDDVHALMEELDKLPRGAGWETQYYIVREAFNDEVLQGMTAMSTPAHCAKMLWLNKCCFNGLWRENKRGLMNSPVGSYVRPSIPSKEHLRSCSGALQGVILRTSDFAAVMELSGNGDRLYCDPPYVPRSATSSFTSYTKGGFPWSEQVRLAQAAKAAVERGSRVVLSNHDMTIVRELYGDLGFTFGCIQTRRSISCKGSGRRERVGELLIWGGHEDRVLYPRK